jgi:hypothetical protein
MTDDLEWMSPVDDPTRPERAPKVCRHRWETRTVVRIPIPGQPVQLPTEMAACVRCGKVQDPAVSRRGRNNRARGNAIEREVGKQLGLRRVGQYGGPEDLSGDLFAAQVKSGGAFSERVWSWLKAVPVNAGQTPLLVITDAPGPGHKRRAVVVVEINDWIALHGPTTEGNP